MAITGEAIAAAGIFACGLGIAWAVFRPREANGLACWAVLYIDDNAVMQRTHVRVLSVGPVERRLVGWCSAKGRERAFRVSKIVEARDEPAARLSTWSDGWKGSRLSQSAVSERFSIEKKSSTTGSA